MNFGFSILDFRLRINKHEKPLNATKTTNLRYLILDCRSYVMTKKIFVALLATLMLSSVFLARAQQRGKVPRIGFLAAPSPSFFSTRMNAFRDGLHDLGHVEGRNIAIEYRYAGGKLDRLPALAAELVRLKVDVIVTSSAPGALAAKNATSTIPVVFVTAGDPVDMGLVTSLARPGGNITGLTTHAPELSGKRLELLKEVLPRTTRVAVLWNPSNPGFSEMLKEMQAASQAHALQLQSWRCGASRISMAHLNP